jgi:hypothetical protein
MQDQHATHGARHARMALIATICTCTYAHMHYICAYVHMHACMHVQPCPAASSQQCSSERVSQSQQPTAAATASSQQERSSSQVVKRARTRSRSPAGSKKQKRSPVWCGKLQREKIACVWAAAGARCRDARCKLQVAVGSCCGCGNQSRAAASRASSVPTHAVRQMSKWGRRRLDRNAVGSREGFVVRKMVHLG